jgi:hypothetical protein
MNGIEIMNLWMEKKKGVKSDLCKKVEVRMRWGKCARWEELKCKGKKKVWDIL